jgi:hypothetical protein
VEVTEIGIELQYLAYIILNVASSGKSMNFSIHLFLIFKMKIEKTYVYDNVAVMKFLLMKGVSSFGTD